MFIHVIGSGGVQLLICIGTKVAAVCWLGFGKGRRKDSSLSSGLVSDRLHPRSKATRGNVDINFAEQVIHEGIVFGSFDRL
jgi:hypothetical protein